MPRSRAAWEEDSNGPFNKRSRSITCHMENKTNIDFFFTLDIHKITFMHTRYLT